MSERPAGSAPSRAAAFAWVALAYGVAGLVAAIVAIACGGAPAWGIVAAADGAATVVIFVFSRIFNNSSFYDVYWSVAPMVIAPGLGLGAGAPGAPMARRIVVTALVVFWGARLTYNWVRGWTGLDHEDWRYVDLRRTTGRAYWLVSFFGLHAMPTALVFLACLPLFPALATGTRALGPLDALALGITAGAIAIEAVADEQLRAFRRENDSAKSTARRAGDAGSHPAQPSPEGAKENTNDNAKSTARRAGDAGSHPARPSPEGARENTHTVPGRIMAAGLWGRCRHPNYLGEIGFWCGLFAFAMAADPAAWWTAVGPLSILGLFVFISVPLIDRRSLARRPGYADHMARVPALLPRLFTRPER